VLDAAYGTLYEEMHIDIFIAVSIWYWTWLEFGSCHFTGQPSVCLQSIAEVDM